MGEGQLVLDILRWVPLRLHDRGRGRVHHGQIVAAGEGAWFGRFGQQPQLSCGVTASCEVGRRCRDVAARNDELQLRAGGLSLIKRRGLACTLLVRQP